MAVNVEKLFVEVTVEWGWPSLRVELIISSNLGPCNGCLIFSALCVVDILVLTSDTFFLGFTVARGLSTLTLKIVPPRKGGRMSCSMKVSVRVSMEP